jgi:hypothetical protein
MSGLKRNIPVPTADPKSYKILLKKEKLQNPALVTYRKHMLQKMQTNNYINEYDRILGLLEGHADRFALPGGHFEKDKLTNRLQMLKKLFKEAHNEEKHPIMKNNI